MAASDGKGGTDSIAITVNLTDVAEATSVTGCFTTIGTLTATTEYAGSWNVADYGFRNVAAYLNNPTQEGISWDWEPAGFRKLRTMSEETVYPMCWAPPEKCFAQPTVCWLVV